MIPLAPSEQLATPNPQPERPSVTDIAQPTTPPPTHATTNGNAPETEMTDAERKALRLLEQMQRIDALRANGWKVELSGSQWATLHDPDVVLERQARAIKVAMLRSAPDGTHLDADAMIQSSYVVAAAFIAAWSLPLPLPTVTETASLLEVPARDFSILSAVTGDLRDVLFAEAPTATAEIN